MSGLRPSRRRHQRSECGSNEEPGSRSVPLAPVLTIASVRGRAIGSGRHRGRWSLIAYWRPHHSMFKPESPLPGSELQTRSQQVGRQQRGAAREGVAGAVIPMRQTRLATPGTSTSSPPRTPPKRGSRNTTRRRGLLRMRPPNKASYFLAWDFHFQRVAMSRR